MTRIVIVDDNTLIRKQLATLFQESFGFEVAAEGKDGIEAVELFQSLKPDLITLDLTMPRKGGLEALEDILASAPDARILVISAITDAASITRAITRGARGYIKKPLRIKDPQFIKQVGEDIQEALA